MDDNSSNNNPKSTTTMTHQDTADSEQKPTQGNNNNNNNISVEEAQSMLKQNLRFLDVDDDDDDDGDDNSSIYSSDDVGSWSEDGGTMRECDKVNIEQKVYHAFHSAFEALGHSVEEQTERSLARLICTIMGNNNRVYHATPHVFDLFTCAETQPISCLAALFHDTVYLTVDNGLEQSAMDLLEEAGVIYTGKQEAEAHNQPLVVFQIQQVHPSINSTSGTHDSSGDDTDEGKYESDSADQNITLTPATESSTTLIPHGKLRPSLEAARAVDPKHSLPVGLCCKVFGWDPTKPLRAGDLGVNEFLSAVLALQSMLDILTLDELFQIVVCIEATIPFRNTTVYNELFLRAKDTAAATPGLDNLSSTRILSHVAKACILAERDVGNFASIDARYFLEKAWMLLPEINVSLRRPSKYTILDYARAMLGMVKFYEFLLPSPDRVFPPMGAARSELEQQRLISATTRNLKIGIEYCRTKFVTACIVDALVEGANKDSSLAIPAAFYCGKGMGVDIISYSRSNSSCGSRVESSHNLSATQPAAVLSRRATSIQANFHSKGDISNKDVEMYSSFMIMEIAAKFKPVTHPTMRMERRKSSIPSHFGDSSSISGNMVRVLSTSTVGSNASPDFEMLRRESQASVVGDFFFTDLLVPCYDYVDNLLLVGTGYSSAFDFSYDLTSHHVHKTLGKNGGLEAAYRLSVEYLAEDISPDEFLQQFTDDVIDTLRTSITSARNDLHTGKRRTKSSGAIIGLSALALAQQNDLF